MHPLIKLALLIGAVCLAVTVFIVFIHILPWIIGILVVCAVVKLYHWFNQPRDNRPLPRWPWRDP
jgi:fatty acid desaturase